MVASLVMGLLLATAPAWAEYTLSSGDTLEVTVFRVPELSRAVNVDVDGRIAYPPLGRLDVQGRGIDAVSDLIRDMLSKQEILSDPQVTVALTATRPVFIGGDVTTPGAYPYQAGLTVRHAIALAGGLGLARLRAVDEISTLRGERDLTAIDMLHQRARFARIEAELAGTETFTPPPPEPDMSPARRDEVLALEARKLTNALAEAREEKAHLERAVGLVRDQIDTLSKARDLQAELIVRQTGEIARIREIQDRGLASQMRVTEEQRVLDTMQERAAANETEMATALESLETTTYAFDRFDARRRAGLEAEKQDALLAIQTGHARLRATDTRLAELGASDAGRMSIVVYRAGDAGQGGTPAGYDTSLDPGDTLDISFESATAEAPVETVEPAGAQP
jgi:polysaccharide export outer membrane protein